jgi:flagellar basal-body rod protein FlgC
MGMFDAMEISASGLTAERMRMDVVAQNLANAQTTRGVDGQPYRRKEVVLAERGGEGTFGAALAGAMSSGTKTTSSSGTSGALGGVEVAAIAEDQTPLKQVYDPGHPDADANGYVQMPNVDSVAEMVDLISAQRAYEANVTAMQAAKQMFAKTLELLR